MYLRMSSRCADEVIVLHAISPKHKTDEMNVRSFLSTLMAAFTKYKVLNHSMKIFKHDKNYACHVIDAAIQIRKVRHALDMFVYFQLWP